MAVYFLSIDALPACSLGCYGEHRIPTPNFDQLASRSVVCNLYYKNADDLVATLKTSFPEVAHFHWSEPQLEVATLLEGAKCWLSDEELEPIFSVEGDEALHYAMDRLSDSVPASQKQLIEASATALAHDVALGEWLPGMRFESGDVLVIAGETGDIRRLPEPRADWLSVVSEPLVHLPLLIHVFGNEEHERVNPLVQTSDIKTLLSQLIKEGPAAVRHWITSLATDEIRWEFPTTRALRTEKWMVAEKLGTEDGSPVLVLTRKPEDLWDMLDVASQHLDLVELYLSTGALQTTES